MTKVYVLTLVTPDAVNTAVYSTAAKCREAYREAVNMVAARAVDDTDNLDLVLEDNDGDGHFDDGYGVTIVWSGEDVTD